MYNPFHCYASSPVKTQACSACRTVSFFTVSQMCTTSYVCMQVSRNLADDNTPQLCLLKAFLTFWGTRDFIIAVSSQWSRIQMYSLSRRQCIACVAAHATEILPKLAGKSFASASKAVIPSILLRYLSANRLEFGLNSRRQFKGYIFLSL